MKKIAFILIFPLLLGCSTGETTSDSHNVSNTWDAEKKLEELGIDLPDASSPVANYVNAVKVGNLLFLSGKGPNLPDGSYVTGKVGEDLSIEEGKEASRLFGIAQLAVLKS